MSRRRSPFLAFAVLSLWLSLLPSQSFGLVEIRGSYGITFNNPVDLNDRYLFPRTLSSNYAITQMNGPGIDVLVNLPMLPVGLGARFEKWDRNVSATAFGVDRTAKVDDTRFALLANYRFLDTGMFLGAIGSVGIYHISKFGLNPDSVGVPTSYEANSTMSFSVGAEGGLKINGILLGAELSYLYYSAADYRGDGGYALTDVYTGRRLTGELSGICLKGLVGYEF